MDSSEEQMRAWRNAEQQEYLRQHPIRASSQFMRLMKQVKKAAWGYDGRLVIEVSVLRAILREEL